MESAYEKTNQIGEGTYGQVCVVSASQVSFCAGVLHAYILLSPSAKAESVAAKSDVSIANHSWNHAFHKLDWRNWSASS